QSECLRARTAARRFRIGQSASPNRDDSSLVGHDADVGDGSDLDAVSLGEYTPVAPPPTRSRRRPNSLAVAALSGLAVGLALTLAVAVLDSDGDSGEAGAGVCRLLGPADIAVVLGSPVEPVRPRVLIRPEPGLGSCGYPTSSSFGEIVVHEQRPG